MFSLTLLLLVVHTVVPVSSKLQCQCYNGRYEIHVHVRAPLCTNTVKSGWLFWQKVMSSQFHPNSFLAWEPFPSKEIDSRSLLCMHVIVHSSYLVIHHYLRNFLKTNVNQCSQHHKLWQRKLVEETEKTQHDGKTTIMFLQWYVRKWWYEAMHKQ